MTMTFTKEILIYCKKKEQETIIKSFLQSKLPHKANLTYLASKHLFRPKYKKSEC